MADSKRTFKLLFGAEDKGLKKAIDGYADQIEKIGQTSQDIAAPFVSVAEKVLAVDAALAAVAGTLLKIS